ncbi:MAG: hypothetical protein AUG51_14785 [Acidobacteria bacterium 13_1_20CM_3_53_8]|nr:MAG: hypothetical protein AUG51_14785 [Acidobacteria bacterium 13_1_20CM_3_53_8]
MKNKGFTSAIIAAALIIVTASYALAQSGVLNKPYQQWTKADVIKLLTDSPWARTQTIRLQRRGQVRAIAGQTSTVGGSLGAPAVGNTGELSSAEDPVDYKFTLRLRSALPVRQAIVRLVQLDQQYDQMTLQQKSALDAQTRELLDCPECRENYIISVGFGSSNADNIDLIYEWFRGQSVQSLKNYIYIANDRGERRELSRFIAPKVQGDEAFFFFKRIGSNERPLLTPDSKKLLFRMSDVNARSVTNFDIDVTKLVVDGQVQF